MTSSGIAIPARFYFLKQHTLDAPVLPPADAVLGGRQRLGDWAVVHMAASGSAAVILWVAMLEREGA